MLLVYYPSGLPSYPSRPGHAIAVHGETPESLLVCPDLKWLGLLAIVLPQNWDGRRTEFHFHDCGHGLYTLKTEPVWEGPPDQPTLWMEKISDI